MSQPVAVNSAICCSVALMSAVSVVVIDCTLIGASPPTSTLPTLICRVCRRAARVGGGRVGIPRSILMRPFVVSADHQVRAVSPPIKRSHLGRNSLRGVKAQSSAPLIGGSWLSRRYRRFGADLGKAPREEDSLGFIADQPEGQPIGVRRFAVAVEFAQQIGTHGMQYVVAV